MHYNNNVTNKHLFISTPYMPLGVQAHYLRTQSGIDNKSTDSHTRESDRGHGRPY